MNKPNDKKVIWIEDDLIKENTLILTTPQEIEKVLKRYIKKTEPKVFMISTNTKKDKKDKNGITKKNQ